MWAACCHLLPGRLRHRGRRPLPQEPGSPSTSFYSGYVGSDLDQAKLLSGTWVGTQPSASYSTPTPAGSNHRAQYPSLGLSGTWVTSPLAALPQAHYHFQDKELQFQHEELQLQQLQQLQLHHLNQLQPPEDWVRSSQEWYHHLQQLQQLQLRHLHQRQLQQLRHLQPIENHLRIQRLQRSQLEQLQQLQLQQLHHLQLRLQTLQLQPLNDPQREQQGIYQQLRQLQACQRGQLQRIHFRLQQRRQSNDPLQSSQEWVQQFQQLQQLQLQQLQQRHLQHLQQSQLRFQTQRLQRQLGPRSATLSPEDTVNHRHQQILPPKPQLILAGKAGRCHGRPRCWGGSGGPGGEVVEM